VLYDGSCALCRATAARFAPALLRKGFQVLPLQDSRVFRELNLSSDELLREMRVVTSDGDVLGGGVAVANLARHFWWGLPLYWFSRLPGCGRLLDSAYAWLAARRHCIGGACSLPERTQQPWAGLRIAVAWAPLLLLPIAAGRTFQSAPPWMLMWGIAASLWRTHDAASARLMVAFHRALRERRDPIAALALAEREAASASPHPSTWAPFVLVLRPSAP